MAYESNWEWLKIICTPKNSHWYFCLTKPHVPCLNPHQAPNGSHWQPRSVVRQRERSSDRIFLALGTFLLGASSHESFRWVSSPQIFLWTTLPPQKSHWNQKGWFTHLPTMTVGSSPPSMGYVREYLHKIWLNIWYLVPPFKDPDLPIDLENPQWRSPERGVPPNQSKSST